MASRPKKHRDHEPSDATYSALVDYFGPLSFGRRGRNYLQGNGVRIYMSRRDGQISIGRAKINWTEAGRSIGYIGIGEPEGDRVYLIDVDELRKHVPFSGHNNNELRFRANWDESEGLARAFGKEIPGTLIEPGEPLPPWPRREEAAMRSAGQRPLPSGSGVPSAPKKILPPAGLLDIPDHLKAHTYHLRPRPGGHLAVCVHLWDGALILRKGSVGRFDASRVRDKKYLGWREQQLSKMQPLEGEETLFRLAEDVLAPSWYYATKLIDPTAQKSKAQDYWSEISEIIGEPEGDEGTGDA